MKSLKKLSRKVTTGSEPTKIPGVQSITLFLNEAKSGYRLPKHPSAWFCGEGVMHLFELDELLPKRLKIDISTKSLPGTAMIEILRVSIEVDPKLYSEESYVALTLYVQDSHKFLRTQYIHIPRVLVEALKLKVSSKLQVRYFKITHES